LHQFLVAPLFSYTRFGKWDLILSEPSPPEDSPFWTGVWHYARGLAFTATGKVNEASKELGSLRNIAEDKSLEGYRVTFSRNGAKAILDIATAVLEGELAAKRGEYDKAIAQLHRGVLLEDNLIYNEPPDWHVPVRQSLGAVLLEAGRPAEAEAIYWQDLQLNRENGWSLFGLMQSLKAQGKQEEASLVEKRFRKAWSQADVILIASRFMDEARTAMATKR
jgi:tetratricopeptide (TPR) repeat protein